MQTFPLTYVLSEILNVPAAQMQATVENYLSCADRDPDGPIDETSQHYAG